MRGLANTTILRARRRQLTKPQVHFRTSSWGFALWWLILLSIHVVNVMYYAVVALLYVAVNGTFLDLQLAAYAIGIPRTEYHRVAAVHVGLAVIHALFVLMMIGSSIYSRRLAFWPDLQPFLRKVALSVRSSRRYSYAPASPSKRTADSSRESSFQSNGIHKKLASSVIRTGSAIFSRDGLLGVDSVYFDHILLLRELLETGLQSYQLYRMTHLLPRLWLIRVYVVLLIANCWSVPALHQYYRNREVTRRLLSLLCDAVLDILSSVGITMILFAVYAPQYEPGYGFPFLTWFDDKWITNLQQEFQMMLVASWGDMFSRLVFAFGLLQGMESIKDMLAPTRADSEPSKPTDTPSIAVASTRKILAGNAEDIQRQSSMDKAAAKTAVAAVSKPTHPSALKRVITFIVHVVGPGAFVLWGCAILVVHLLSEARHSDQPCELRLQPWLSSKPGCSLVEVNCFALQSNGHDEILDNRLNIFDPNRVTQLVIRHCPQLVLPPKLLEFHQLSGIKIYNSTIVAWDTDAALTESTHSNMRSLYFVRTFLPGGELPAGLLSPDFPQLLNTFASSITNIERLPDDLHTKWPRFMTITLEFSRVVTIPDVLLRMLPTIISVSGTAVSHVRPEFFEIPSLVTLVLSLTRVQELPANVTVLSPRFKCLVLHELGVSTFWSWMNDYISKAASFVIPLFMARGTGYCRELAEIANGTRRTFSTVEGATDLTRFASVMDVSTPEKLAFAHRAVDCFGGFPTHFPLPIEDAAHGLSHA